MFLFLFSADFSTEFKNYCKSRNQQPNDTLFAAWLSCVRDYLTTDRKGRAKRQQQQQSSSSVPPQSSSSSSSRRSSRRRNQPNQPSTSASSHQQSSSSSYRRSNRRRNQQPQQSQHVLETVEEKDPAQIPEEGKSDGGGEERNDESWIPGSPNTRAKNSKPHRQGGRKGRKLDKFNKGEVKKMNTWNKRLLDFVFFQIIYFVDQEQNSRFLKNGLHLKMINVYQQIFGKMELVRLFSDGILSTSDVFASHVFGMKMELNQLRVEL